MITRQADTVDSRRAPASGSNRQPLRALSRVALSRCEPWACPPGRWALRRHTRAPIGPSGPNARAVTGRRHAEQHHVESRVELLVRNTPMKYWLRSGLGSGLLAAGVVIGFAACSSDPLDPKEGASAADTADASAAPIQFKGAGRDIDVSMRALTRISDLTSRFVFESKARPQIGAQAGAAQPGAPVAMPPLPQGIQPPPDQKAA